MDTVHLEHDHSQDSSCFLSSDFSEASNRAFRGSNEEVSKMAKKEHKQGNISIENIKKELVSQITGLTEVQSDQAGVQLTKEIYGKKIAVNVYIQASSENDIALVEVQLLAKPFVNEAKKIETKISGKHNDTVLLIKKAIRSCRMLHGIKIEIDSIVKDFEAS